MFPLTWISCVFKLRLVCWCGSVQTPRVKTDECKDLQLFPVRFPPSNDVSNALTPFYLLLYFLFPLLSSFPHLYHVFPIHSGCLTGMLLHQTQSATQSCSPAFYLHLFFFTPFFLYGPLELSVCGRDGSEHVAVPFGSRTNSKWK